MNRSGRAEPTPPECAAAAEVFDLFCSAGTMKTILGCHREICHTLNLRPNKLPDFYPKLKLKLASSWKAQALFKKFDARANHKVYAKGRACAATKVLVIGAGPCGLRAAIECQLLGAKVVVIEKRDRMSRNNVLHLWPFVIQDLRALGAKKFFGKFCAGSIDHISIRQLQCILLKVALLLGVEFHEGVSFEELLEPTVLENSETMGWRARVSPAEHPVSQYEFDVLLGADGKRNTLHGFKRKEFRGKLAMAITANFINRHTEQEASVPEISGVAFIFNQKFFKELHEATGIDLENIVYYKDDTHYFVMTAKKHSLLDKGVLLNDYAEVSRLLNVDNVDRGALMRYAQEAARFSTDNRLPLRDFALNHYGEPDVALFDFTSMYAAENASLVRERAGRRLLCQLVGDSLLEPFWPTGSGCARGFLSALDAAWAARAWGQSPAAHPLHVIAERESVFRLLAQTTPENLHRDFGAYTLDPGTRYPNLNRAAVSPHRVTGFYDSDEPLPLDAVLTARKRRREGDVPEEVLLAWVGCAEGGVRAAASAHALTAAVRRYRPDLLPPTAPLRNVYYVLQKEFGIAPFSSSGNPRDVPEARLRSYLSRVYTAFKGEVPHVQHQTDVFDQIKLSLQKEKHVRNATDHSISAYSNAAEADKSHSSYRKKRRSVRTPQVSSASAEYLRRRIGRLELDDVTQLARLIDGGGVPDDLPRAERQQHLQEQILALLDCDDSPDPKLLRESVAQLFQGTVKTKVQHHDNLTDFFSDSTDHKPVEPSRRLKGLDASSIKVPDFSDIFGESDADETLASDSPRTDLFHASLKETPNKKELVRASSLDVPKKKELVRATSIESVAPKGRRLSEVMDLYKRRHSQSPDVGRSSSLGASNVPDLAPNTRRIAQIFESSKRRHTPSPEARIAPTINPQMALRMQRMVDMIEGKRRATPSPERTKRSQSIGNPEMALRRQRMVDLIEGVKPRQAPPTPKAGELSFHMQRASDMMARRVGRGGKGGGRRRAAREITRQRFEKSLQMLTGEPRPPPGQATLEHDYDLQQYRASAPHFNDRVKKLEQQLQHYEEGREVGGGARTSGGGARVARLAAELAGTGNSSGPRPQAQKPRDLMRSVGRIERDDWNVREIERKIQENRLGRPEPRAAERVPKWDREQFLGRQRRLKEGDAGEEKWMEIDETLSKLDQKLRDAGRPDHGTNKVANLATKFVKKEEIEPAAKPQPKEEKKKWRSGSGGGGGGGGAAAGVPCASCGARVFAAERVAADGLTLHRGCFRCALCKAALRPGNYTMERYGTRLVCLRHSGVLIPDAVPDAPVPVRHVRTPATPTPERISLELSDGGAREIDEDEWTDRNFLASETSGAGLSDEELSSSDEYTDAADSDNERALSPEPAPAPLPPALYCSDDSFGYDDYSDDGAESSGNESCSRMREAREARRREVPADARPPTDSSEVESEEESESSDESVSSATEVSTDSEFAREEGPPPPPAILVTAPPAPLVVVPVVPPAPPPPNPLARTRSAGGIATKRALELKRKYLLGECSPQAVRKSDSTSQIDTKLETFRSNITEFQKMLHPAPTPSAQPQQPIFSFNFATEEKSKPMPDIIRNLITAPVDLLTKGDSPLCKDWPDDPISENKEPDPEQEPELELDSDSLSESSSCTETGPEQPVPRVEVHDEGGELIQLDSLMLVDSQDSQERTSEAPITVAPLVLDSESSESGRDGTTLLLTETELSDWAGECGLEEDKRRAPRALNRPKPLPPSPHVCGRRPSPPPPTTLTASFEDFQFADEGDPDPALEAPPSPANRGYMHLVDDYDYYTPTNDRSINFIERTCSETVYKPEDIAAPPKAIYPDISLDHVQENGVTAELKSPQLLKSIDIETSEKSNEETLKGSDSAVTITQVESDDVQVESTAESSPPPDLRLAEPSVTDLSPPLVPDTPVSPKIFAGSDVPLKFASPANIRLYSPAICRSASETFNRSMSRSTDSTKSIDLSMSINLSSGSVSPVSPPRDKVQEIKREREEQTEVVRRLVLERLGGGSRGGRRSRRVKVSPTLAPPPVPPPPSEPPAPPPRPAPPLMPFPLPVTPSFSDPELARERRSRSFMKSISNYLNRRLGPRHKWASEPAVSSHEGHRPAAHKSTGALQEAPPVPPPPASYCPPVEGRHNHARLPGPSSGGCAGGGGGGGVPDVDERDAMQLWFEARWARLVAQRRARDEPAGGHGAGRLARLERRLTRPLSAEQQAATVAELVQVSAQREAHQALMAADRRRSAAGSGVGD